MEEILSKSLTSRILVADTYLLVLRLNALTAGARASFNNGCDHLVGELFDAIFSISPIQRDKDDLDSSPQFYDSVPKLVFLSFSEI